MKTRNSPLPVSAIRPNSKKIHRFYIFINVALFGHPLVEAITGWDFADGAWLHAPSGLIREDNTPKPSYYELQRLVKEEWSTKAALCTDENGMVLLDGYRGTYEVTVNGKTVNYKLCKNAEDNPVRIVIE